MAFQAGRGYFSLDYKIYYYTEDAATSVSILFLNWEILVIYSQSTAPKILILNPLKL